MRVEKAFKTLQKKKKMSSEMEQTFIKLERHLNLDEDEIFLFSIPQGSRKASAFIKHRLDGGHGVEH